MARLQRRSEELPLRADRVLRLLLFLFLAGAPLAAQGRGEAVRGLVGASSGLTRVLGETGVLLGVDVLVEVSPEWRAGGGGHTLVEGVRFGEGEGGESELRLGYGGVFVEWSVRGEATEQERTRLRARVTAGAGHAELHQPLIGFSAASDNFIVLEPGVVAERRLLGRLSGALSAHYRWALAVEDLGGLGSRDLSGATLGVELRLGPF